MSPTSYQTAPPRGKNESIPCYAALILKNLKLKLRQLHLRGRRLIGHIRTINQFNQSHGCVVANAVTHFQDACVTTGALVKAGAEVCEQLGHAVAIAQAVESQAAVGHCVDLGQCDHRLDHTAQFFGLWHCCFDDFVLNDGVHHVLQHSQAV